MDALEIEMRGLRQSNRELIEAVREATAESKRRSVALDDLARKLLAGDSGIKLLKTTGENPAVTDNEERPK
jgi:dihydropteroate synthase